MQIYPEAISVEGKIQVRALLRDGAIRRLRATLYIDRLLERKDEVA
jgi:hypothetical protein